MALLSQGLTWNGPRNYRTRAQFQGELPEDPGFYIFTDCEELRPGAVLYIGASLNLRRRIQQYDLNNLDGDSRSDVSHAGMMQIRTWLTNPRNPTFVWWAIYRPLKKEKELVTAFVPRFNDNLTNGIADAWLPKRR